MHAHHELLRQLSLKLAGVQPDDVVVLARALLRSYDSLSRFAAESLVSG